MQHAVLAIGDRIAPNDVTAKTGSRVTPSPANATVRQVGEDGAAAKVSDRLFAPQIVLDILHDKHPSNKVQKAFLCC